MYSFELSKGGLRHLVVLSRAKAKDNLLSASFYPSIYIFEHVGLVRMQVI